MERLTWLLEGAGSAGGPVVVCLLFVLYGATLARLLGVRAPLIAAGVGLPVAIGLLALSAEVRGLVGFQAPFVVDSLISVLAAAVVGRLGRARPAEVPATVSGGGREALVPVAGAALGGLLGGAAWLAGIGNFRLPPQANDDIWHGYLVTRLTQMPAVTAGSVAPELVDSLQPVWHYPYGLHLAEALLYELTPVGIASLLNGAWVVFVGLLLPVGLVALTGSLWPNRPWAAFWAGVLAPSMVIFPYLTNGIVAYTVGLAMLPGFLALLLTVLRIGGRQGTALALAAIGILVTHPLAAAVAGALAVPIVAEGLIRGGRSGSAAAIRRLAGPAALALIGGLPWLLDRQPSIVLPPGPVVDGLVPAFASLASLSSPWTPPQYPLALLVAVGAVSTIVSRRGVGLTVGVVAFGMLYVADIAGLPALSTITGAFLGWYRMLAPVGLLVPILASLGIVTIAAALGTGLLRRRAGARPVAVAVALGVGLLAGNLVLRGASSGMSIVRSAWHDPRLVTVADTLLFDALARRLGPGDRVLNSPRDGSSWMFAMSGLTPVIPYPTPGARLWSEVYAGQGEFASAAAVCRRLADAHATHAVVKVVAGDAGDFDISGFVGRYSNLFVLILRAETATAYEVDQEAVARCASG